MSRTSRFFKSEAAKADTLYQRMIRRLLDACVEAHAKAVGIQGAQQALACLIPARGLRTVRKTSLRRDAVRGTTHSELVDSAPGAREAS